MVVNLYEISNYILLSFIAYVYLSLFERQMGQVRNVSMLTGRSCELIQ